LQKPAETGGESLGTAVFAGYHAGLGGFRDGEHRGMRLTQRLLLWLILVGLSAPACLAAICDTSHSCDPPTSYYNGTVSGGVILTGSGLKDALHTIISPSPPGGPTNPFPVVSRNYDSARSSLQLTDADPNVPGNMLSVYDRVSIDLAAIVPTNPPNPPIYGWDAGHTWNREHTWPQSRGITNTSPPDGTDLFELRPALSSNNDSRQNKNYGGAFGAQPFGSVIDNGNSMYYPGDADAGMIAREEFYMATRYNGSESGTNDLELMAGNPDTTNNPNKLGDLNRMIEWNYAAPPDAFERNRNQVIFGSNSNSSPLDHALNPLYYQGNRNPFTDHPEWVWSIFAKDASNNPIPNDSQVSIAGTTVNTNGSSAKSIDFGKVFVGAATPTSQSVSLNKAGLDGTYYALTPAADNNGSNDAYSPSLGRFNAFRTNQTDSKTISVGFDPMNANLTSTAGHRGGSIIVDNLDITDGGTGHGVNDADDTINLSLAVVNHAIASYSANINKRDETIDFGDITFGSAPVMSGASVANWGGLGSPVFAANLDLDSVEGTGGDLGAFDVGLSSFSGLTQNSFFDFYPTFTAGSIGHFSANYTLHLSDEDLPGAQIQTLTLKLVADVIAAILAGDYNGDGVVDAADYTVWRDTFGQSVAAAHDGADGDGDTMIGPGDYQVWVDNFGQMAAGGASGASTAKSAAVPEPGSLCLLGFGFALLLGYRRPQPRVRRRGETP
jgi:endonuclease I